MEHIKYYDIGLNLFCRQFPEPERIVRDAEENGVCCILTGTDTKENKRIVAVGMIPLDRILVETDAPYLTPRNAGLDRTNVPQNIRYVVRELANYMKVSEAVLTENTRKNTERIFGINT